ncbi:NAD(P)-dependent oxidoreductase [Streptomyces albiaxialis]|uniref:NAD(P)-dependent oxidoreductase n=2 Tax=Streptomyces albiaxialis TaxID=329523 RepID=A0ABN2WBI5_9ACTN
MARNLARAGLDVRAWNRTHAKALPLADEGIRVAEDAADAVRGADVVLTVLFDAPSVLEAMGAAAPGLAEGTLWTQASTVGPDGIPPLTGFAGEHGLRFVDSPVLGTKAPAESGQLTVLAAAPEDVRDDAAPVFDAIGQKTLWLGTEPGAASRFKLVVNNWVLTVINGTAETLALAEGFGFDPRSFLEAVGGGPLDMPYLRMKAGLILDGEFSASFPLAGARKDAELISRAAEEAGVRLDLAPAGAARLRRAEERGHGREDAAASYFASFD